MFHGGGAMAVRISAVSAKNRVPVLFVRRVRAFNLPAVKIP
jgi:hypothetical protein